MAKLSRDLARPVAIALSAAAILAAVPARAQTENGPDTRLRLDQQLDRQRADREARTLEGAEDLGGVPSTIVIEGQTYAVGNNIDDMGRALYVAVARKQWSDVRRFLAAYLKLDGHDRLLVHYATGALARNDGDLVAAERSYRALLAIKPDFLPGQLELARTLFDNRKDRDAERAFALARGQLGGPEAEGVRQTVDAYLLASKRRQAWQGSFAIGPSYSSNVNQSSASYTCLLAADDGSCLIDRKVPNAIRSAGLSFEGTLSRRVALGGHSGLRARAILFGDYYPEHHDYSQGSLIARLGYDYQTARDGLSLSPSLDLGTLGSLLLYRAWGVNAEWTHNFSAKAMARLEANRRSFDYPLPGYQGQDGTLTDSYLTGWYALPHGWVVSGGPDFVSKTTDNPADGYRQWGMRLGINKSIGNAVNLLVLGALRERTYRAFSELFEARRRDREQIYTGIVRLPALGFAGLIPEAVIQHNRVKSNIDWLYSYRRTTASLRLSYAF